MVEWTYKLKNAAHREDMDMKAAMPKIALGAWSWGSGTAGGDQVFGNHLEEKDLQPIFDAAMNRGLNLWDTATVYGMGASEDILGSFAKQVKREEILISTKFTSQIAGMYDDSMEKMADAMELYRDRAAYEAYSSSKACQELQRKIAPMLISSHTVENLTANIPLSAKGIHVKK